MSNTNADQRDRVLGDPDGAVQQPSPITAAFLTDLQRIVPPEDLGEAWMFAQRCARDYDTSHRGSAGATVNFRQYFYMRWRYHRIDMHRAEHGRVHRNPKVGTRQNRRLKALRPFTNAPGRVFDRRAVDRTVEDRDAIAFYKGQCRSRVHRMVVDCVSSGLTLGQTATAIGFASQSRVGQVLREMRYLTVSRSNA